MMAQVRTGREDTGNLYLGYKVKGSGDNYNYVEAKKVKNGNTEYYQASIAASHPLNLELYMIWRSSRRQMIPIHRSHQSKQEAHTLTYILFSPSPAVMMLRKILPKHSICMPKPQKTIFLRFKIKE